MEPLLILVGIGIVIAGLAAAILVGHARFDRETEQIVTWLLAASEGAPDALVREDELADLPPPIRRYLRHVLREEQPYIETARLEQTGRFRSGSSSSPWSPFTATQHVTTLPPGFVWNATIEMVPALPVRVIDEYRDGQGALRAKLAGLLSVADAAPEDSLDEGELMRYLAEAPLYPTALLPSMGVHWSPIDGTSARATLEHNDTTASLVFHVNDENEVERVCGRRAFTKADGSSEYQPWVGDWWNYQRRDGMLVPTDGKVAWIRHEGEFSYWRGHIDTIEYQFGTRRELTALHTSGPSERRPYSLE